MGPKSGSCDFCGLAGWLWCYYHILNILVHILLRTNQRISPNRSFIENFRLQPRLVSICDGHDSSLDISMHVFRPSRTLDFSFAGVGMQDGQCSGSRAPAPAAPPRPRRRSAVFGTACTRAAAPTPAPAAGVPLKTRRPRARCSGRAGPATVLWGIVSCFEHSRDRKYLFGGGGGAKLAPGCSCHSCPGCASANGSQSSDAGPTPRGRRMGESMATTRGRGGGAVQEGGGAEGSSARQWA